MTDAPVATPAALVVRAVPGTAGTAVVSLGQYTADPHVHVVVTGDGLSAEIAITTPLWYEYTDQDILDMPIQQREAARKAGGFWTAQTDTIALGTDGSVAIPLKASVAVTVSATPAAAGITTGTVTLTGQVWGTLEVPITVLAGSDAPAPATSSGPVALLCRPGDAPTPWITIQSPQATTALVRLAAGSHPSISISSVVVLVGVRHDWDPDELLDFPVDQRAEMKKEGWLEFQARATGAAGTPLDVPAKGILRVNLAVDPSAMSDRSDASVEVFATAWQTMDVPVAVSVSDFAAVPLTDRMYVPQGGSSGVFGVALSSTYGPDADVRFSIARADPADMWIGPTTATLPSGTRQTIPLTVSLAAHAQLGAYPIYLGESVDVGLRVTAFDGAYDCWFPFGITATPGAATVSVGGDVIEAMQGSSVDVPVIVTVADGIKSFGFTGLGLPGGVSVSAPAQEVSGPTTQTLHLTLTVAPDTRPTQGMAAIAWDAGDGVNSGQIAVPYLIVLRPETRTFTAEVVTESGALGGHLALTVDNLGTGTFSGSMRATGFASYTFRVVMVIRSADGSTAIAVQKTGEVRGTDTPGDREVTWSDPVDTHAISLQWHVLRDATVQISEAHELAGTLGTARDIAVAFVEYLGAVALAGATGGLSLVIYAGAEIGTLTGSDYANAGGLPGVIVTAGAVFLLGPQMLIPVLLTATAIGEAGVQHHPLRKDETDFLQPIFGEGVLPPARILITNMSAVNGAKFTVPSFADHTTILVNLGDAYDDTVGHVEQGKYPQPGQLLVHEMTHAWQIANVYTDPLDYYGRAALTKIQGQPTTLEGHPDSYYTYTYYYTPAGPPFRQFGLEQQASIVDEWAGATDLWATVRPVEGRDPKIHNNPADSYYRYIATNIRSGRL